MVPDYLLKVAKKKLKLGKVARSCLLAKNCSEAKKLPSTIWLCLPLKIVLVSILNDRDLPAVVVALHMHISLPYISAGGLAFVRVPRVAPWSLPQARSPLHLHTHPVVTLGSSPLLCLLCCSL